MPFFTHLLNLVKMQIPQVGEGDLLIYLFLFGDNWGLRFSVRRLRLAHFFICKEVKPVKKHPNFDPIVPLLKSNESFSLTEKEYEKKTGCALPKSNSYLKNGSALSKLAAKHGFEVTVQDRTVSIIKKATP